MHLTDTRRQAGAINSRILLPVAGVIIFIIIAVILLYPRPVPEPETTPVIPAAPKVTSEERGDAAREIIADLENRQEAEGTKQQEVGDSEQQQAGEYEQAYTRAQEYRSQEKFADAQLLYFFAARGGYPPAAFDLATFYDPNHFSPESSLMDKPDPYQAYKWYKQSLELGHDGADTRLTELHAWAEKAAEAGNKDAEQLLLVWE